MAAEPGNAPNVPGFEILDEIGRGGMGVVYRARQLNLNRLVALKVMIAAHHASPEQIERFQNEALNVAGLGHKGIVQIFDVGMAEGLPYISMEYVDGGSLSQRLAQGPFRIREAAELICELALAIEAAHQRGIVHRDLKPANILMAADGKPKITDFGIAKNLSAADSQTRTGDVVGTPDYMAPEQAGGMTKIITPRVDIYALGAILYELLTGRPPFRGCDPVETLMSVLTEEPISVRRLATRVPRDLETICHKCLQKTPSARYATARELAEDIRRFLEGRPILARRVSPWGRVWRWARRRPAWAALIGVAIFSLVSFTAFAAWKNWQLSRALRETQNALRQSSENFRNAIAAAARRMQRYGDPRIDPLREELAFLDAIRSQPADSDSARWERALAANWAGFVYAKLGAAREAEEAFLDAVSILSQLLQYATADRLPLLIDLTQTESRFASFLAKEQRIEEAIEWQERAVARLSDELSRHPRDVDLRRFLGAEYNNLAVYRVQQGSDPADAYQNSRALRQQLATEFPHQPVYQYDLAILNINLAALAMREGRHADAEPLLRESLTALETYVQITGADDEAQRALTSCHLNWAAVLASLSRMDESDRAYAAAMERLRQWLLHAPHSVELRLMLLDGLQNWLNQQVAAERWGEVVAILREMRDIYAELVAEYPGDPSYHEGLEKANERLKLAEDEWRGGG